jgi:hypothetical protein
MTSAPRQPFPPGPVRQLPLTDKPFRHETIRSYLRRLTTLNHLRDNELSFYLDGTDKLGRYDTRFITPATLERLASATGYSAARLRRTFPTQRRTTPAKFTNSLLHHNELPSSHNFKIFDKPIPACAHCAAARLPIGSLITQWAPQDQRICFRHSRWIGPPGFNSSQSQIDLSHAPDVIASAYQHRRLIRHYGQTTVNNSMQRSRLIIANLDHRGFISRRITDRLRVILPEATPLAAYDEDAVAAAHYPDVVAIATIITAPRWRQEFAAPSHIANPALRAFTRQIIAALRLTPSWTMGWQKCELTKWVMDLRPQVRSIELSTLLIENS